MFSSATPKQTLHKILFYCVCVLYEPPIISYLAVTIVIVLTVSSYDYQLRVFYKVFSGKEPFQNIKTFQRFGNRLRSHLQGAR